MKNNLFSPWHTVDTMSPARVTTLQVEMRHPWPHYSGYCYASEVGDNLNHIPQHLWGHGAPREDLSRAQRLIHFCDTTGCRPKPERRAGIPRSHHSIETIDYCDHTTYWLGPNGEPLILTEPYASETEIEAEIVTRHLTAIVVPAPGIYAGGKNGTQSVLMGLPKDQGLLGAISKQLNEAGWPNTGLLREMSFAEALKLSKQQARGVQHG